MRFFYFFAAALLWSAAWAFFPAAHVRPGRTPVLSLAATASAMDWEALSRVNQASPAGSALVTDLALRQQGLGKAHSDNDIRRFDSTAEPRVVFYKDRASWCPYCQKVWLLLEEKRIPYRVEKINMRSYGDKPESFMRICPNGLLPAISIDGGAVQVESVPIMMTLDRLFTGPQHKPMWPSAAPEQARAQKLMSLERTLFGDWCSLVFRGSMGNSAQRRFEQTMDEVNRELQVVSSSPWFLSELSIVDLQYVTHIERMCASCAFWSGLQIRGSRWPAIERWLQAFEKMPSYMATKSDYYTHCLDIPPQYGPGYSLPGSESFQNSILGEDGSWELPLKPFSSADIEPVAAAVGDGDIEESARQEAAFKLIGNHANIVKFACRGPGQPGRKQFQAPLADPYATPNLDYAPDVDDYLRLVAQGLVASSADALDVPKITDGKRRKGVQESLAYLRDRIGVPRDMSYPAARQLRAHLNWVIKSV